MINASFVTGTIWKISVTAAQLWIVVTIIGSKEPKVRHLTALFNDFVDVTPASSEHLWNGAVNRKPKYYDNKLVPRHFVHGEFGACMKWRRKQETEVLRK